MIVVTFLHWFFLAAPRQILEIGLNFLLWGWQFFSIGYLLPRLLSPWHRDITGYGRGFDLKRFLRILTWNLISRLVGAALRATVIVLGALAEAVILFLTAAAFVFWYVLPVVSVMLILFGVVTLLT